MVIWAAVTVLTCVLDAACLNRLRQQGNTIQQYGAATRGAWHQFPQLPTGAMCTFGAAENLAATAVLNGVTGRQTSASESWFAAGMGCATGGSGGGGGSNAARLTKLRSFLNGLDDRQFGRFMESLEQAASKQGSATRPVDETRVILDEAQRRGWTVEPHGVANDWVGGRHIDLFNSSQLKRIHFPVPEGMNP